MRQKKKRKKAGLAPGTLVFTGTQHSENPDIYRVAFDENEATIKNPSHADPLETPSDKVVWYDIKGLHDTGLIERIGQHFNIHPLVLEDILNTQQRPKTEEYGQEIFIVLSALLFDQTSNELCTEQIGLYFGKNFLLTFQENKDDTFIAIRERLQIPNSRMRTRKADYLAYALLDNIVDNYFTVLDQIEERMDALETEISTNPTRQTKLNIHQLKSQMLVFRKAVLPLREAINRFSRIENEAIDTETGIFIRDLYDHVIRIIDLVETYRDILNGLQELYISELSLRMNNVMQVLTIITVIFIPLTFLAGIYGMNFDNMPELHFQNGYYYLLGFMLIIAIMLIFYFRKKKWI